MSGVPLAPGALAAQPLREPLNAETMTSEDFLAMLRALEMDILPR